MKKNFFKRIKNLLNEFSQEKTRLMLQDRYSWKFFRLISPYLLSFFPTYTHKFIGKGRLPSHKNKIDDHVDPCDDFIFRDFRQINENEKKQEINIILKGFSTDNIKNIDKSLPTYIVNMNYEIAFKNFENLIQITCDGGILSGWLGQKKPKYGYKTSKNNILYLMGDSIPDNDMNIKKDEHILEEFYSNFKISYSAADQKRLQVAAMKHKINIDKHPMGSGLWAILYLLKRYNFLNIYGWDEYRNKPFEKMSMVEFIKNQWSIIDLVRSNKQKMKEGTAEVPRRFFCALILSNIYTFKILTSRFTKNRVRIVGNVSEIYKLEPIMLKLKTILFK